MNSIKFKNADESEFQLKNINFNIEKAKMIVLTGLNNSGKVNLKINNL